MTVSAATAGASAAKSRTPSGRERPPRTWATGEEVYELVRQAHAVHSTKRFYRSVGNHCADLYDVLRKRDAVEVRRMELAGRDGWHRITYTQIARDLYDGVESYRDGGIAKHSSIGRWFDRLRDAGLVEWRGVQGHFLEFRLCAVPEAAPGYADGSRPRSSTGSSDGDACQGVRRRRENRRERRAAMVRRWCRRSGQKGVGRYEPGPAISHLPQDLVTPGTGETPTGSPGPGEGQTRARAHAGSIAAAAPWMRSALAACPPTARASLVELWSQNGTGSEGGERLAAPMVGPEALREAVPTGTPVEAALLFWWTTRCPGRPPLLSREACGRLRRHVAQLDRLHGAGAGLDVLARAMAAVHRGQDLHDGAAVHSAGYAVRLVKIEAHAAVRHDRMRRGRRRPGRGRSGPQVGTWRSRTGEADWC